MSSPRSSRLDATAIILLLGLLLCAAFRLVVTNWTSYLNIVIFLVMIGAPLGLALGLSKFKSLASCLFSIGYSLVLFPWLLGSILYDRILWLDRLASMLGRLAMSLDLFSQHKPVEDTLLFIVVISLIFWVLSIFVGFQWSRHENLLAIFIPIWLVMVAIQVYDNHQHNRTIFIILCMFFSLLLLGRRFILNKRLYWNEHGIRYSSESSREMNMILVISTSIIVLLAWIIPVSNQPVMVIQSIWDRISEPWQSARKDLANAVAGLEGTSSSSTYDYYSANLLKLGQKTIVGNAAIFKVLVPPASPSPRHYWRVRVFDSYNNGQWNNATFGNLEILPNQPGLQLPDPISATPDEYIFTVLKGRISNLFTPNQVVWVSRPVDLSFYRLPGGGVDPLLLRSSNPILQGESFRIQAGSVNPTIADLRLAGDEFPDWVKRHYLQLPEQFPARIRNLAIDLTLDQPTTYDKVSAITDYLRKTITYSKVVSRPPLGSDIIEWFLFDYRQGYCNYFATSEVLMLRAVGIPARLVVGFSQGERDIQQEDLFTIRQKDAHTWPEIYFPNIGWVEFEPTSSQPVILRPPGIISTPASVTTPQTISQPDLDGGEETRLPHLPTPLEAEATPSPGEDPEGYSEPAIPPGVVIFLGMLIVALTGYLVRRSQQLRRTIPTPLPVRIRANLEQNAIKVPGWLKKWADIASRSPVQCSFSVVWMSLRLLGQPAHPSVTPREACSNLITCLPEITAEIEQLCEQYQKHIFSQEPVDVNLAHQAALVIRRRLVRAVWERWKNTVRGKLRRKKNG